LYGEKLSLHLLNDIADALDELLLPYTIDLSIFDKLKHPESSAPLFLRKLVLGIPAQASGKNHVVINAFGVPIRPASVSLRHIIASSMLTPLTLPQMTRRRFGCNSRPPLALRMTGAQNYLRLSRTTSPRFAFHGWQRV